jgi:hypothetical protein|tara:strand:+ start:270 stop:521 length:252 start_codon:yes stop_codon:yes gene_type:complete
MPKVSAKREKINAAKSGAPKVPGDTCPSINYVQEIVGQIAERGDDWSEKQAGYINDLLEYVRDANFELRKSSKYWYDKYKEAA